HPPRRPPDADRLRPHGESSKDPPRQRRANRARDDLACAASQAHSLPAHRPARADLAGGPRGRGPDPRPGGQPVRRVSAAQSRSQDESASQGIHGERRACPPEPLQLLAHPEAAHHSPAGQPRASRGGRPSPQDERRVEAIAHLPPGGRRRVHPASRPRQPAPAPGGEPELGEGPGPRLAAGPGVDLPAEVQRRRGARWRRGVSGRGSDETSPPLARQPHGLQHPQHPVPGPDLPSPIHADGVVFDTGRAVLNGNADFLAQPYPGVHALYKVSNVPLDQLRPLSAKANLSLRGGILASNGEFEYGPRHKEVRIDDVSVRGLDLDYIHAAATAAAEKAREKKVAAVARNPSPPVPTLIKHLLLTRSRVGVVNKVPGHNFHLFVDGGELEVTNISTGFRNGPTHARLTGRFMGSGTAHGTATFRDDRNGPDFSFLLAVEHANLPSLNDLLRSYAKLDVAGGTFSVYSEVKVHDGRIDGYLKPLFADVQVYDPKQDKDKPILKKLYEKVVGGVAHVLENRRGEDAT